MWTLASGQVGGEWPRKRQMDKEAGIPGAAEGPSREGGAWKSQ